MKTGVKPILWSAAVLVLFAALLVPGLNLLAAALFLVPLVVLYTTLSRKLFALHLLPVFIIVLIIMGPAALMLGVFFLVPAIVMGHQYRKSASARMVLTAGILSLLGVFLFEMLLFSLLFQFSLASEMGQIIRNGFEDIQAQGLLPAGWEPSMTEDLIRTAAQSITMSIVIVSFFYAVITHWVARRMLRRVHAIEVPGLPPAREWMMPKVLVYYYLIALVLDLISAGDGNSFMDVVLLNLIPLMRLVFTIQAIGFFFFIAHQKRWNRIVPLLLCVPVLLFPPLSLIGVLDVAFPIRKSFKRP